MESSWSFLKLYYDNSISCFDDSISCFEKNADLLKQNEKDFVQEVIWSEGLEVLGIMPFPVWMIPFPVLNTWLELFREYKKHWKKNIFIPSLQSGVINYISCFDYSISCCTFQYNKDLLTMVSSGGKLKTDSFEWVLMGVYYQIEIPYPVSHLKSGKKNWLWMNLRTTN